MQLANQPVRKAGRATRGFTLIEAAVAMGLIGTVFMALYSGITFAISTIQRFREDIRATQILVEKMETIRLYNWDQINGNNGFHIPTTFVATYCPTGNGTNQGVLYSGNLQIKNADLDPNANYEDRMKEVTVKLTWKTGKLNRTRTLTTYVSETGLHTHIYQAHYH